MGYYLIEDENGEIYHIGDMVTILEQKDYEWLVGETVKIVAIDTRNSIGIETDRTIKEISGKHPGHNCGCTAKDYHGWWISLRGFTTLTKYCETPALTEQDAADVLALI